MSTPTKVVLGTLIVALVIGTGLIAGLIVA